MKVVDLKVLAKESGLRGYSKLKKAELITFLQKPTRTRPPKQTRPPPPPPSVGPKQPELLRQLCGRQPSSQEIDMFEQQEMRKSRSQVKTNLRARMIG